MPEEYVGRKFRTVFLKRERAVSSEVLKQLVSSCRMLFERGLTSGFAGNVSVRFEDGFVVKAGGVSFGAVTREDFVFVSEFDFERNVAHVFSRREPSSETPTHALVYKMFLDVNAVVHVHDEVVLKEKRKALKLGAVETGKELSYGTEELALEVARALEGSDYVLIRNHGVISAGPSLQDVVKRVLFFHKKVRDSH